MKTFKQYLKEKVNYNEVISDQLVYLAKKYIRLDLETIFKVIDSTFKYRDRMIIFFLKQLRSEVIYKLNSGLNFIENSDINDATLARQLYDKYFSNNKESPNFINRLSGILSDFEHYYSLNYHKINDYNPHPADRSIFDISSKFSEFENEWRQQVTGLIPDSLRKEQGWKTIIKFSNGWEWMDLGRASCEFEGNSMGHCGNSPNARNSNQTIFSLREPKNGGKYWEPHLTFIYWKQEQSLGEMKGRGNDKPSEKYHDYIIKLL
jgi:hypothetical protein